MLRSPVENGSVWPSVEKKKAGTRLVQTLAGSHFEAGRAVKELGSIRALRVQSLFTRFKLLNCNGRRWNLDLCVLEILNLLGSFMHLPCKTKS